MSPDRDSPLEWTPDGLPRSRRFGDVYFSSEDGLAETRAVFLAGCGLPEAWRGRRRFTVGELGFGTGLNVAALLQLWAEARPPEGRLHVFTVEAYPVDAGEAARALGRWPELEPVAQLMTARWPGRARGVHRIELPELSAIVDVAVMDVASALSGWTGRADAWFLDGFAPSANPDMWTDEVLALAAQRSAPGARAATFTVAGQVRRGLAAAGFGVEKRPGFGRKRERLEARLPGKAADPPQRSVAIVGAGIAGAAAARAVRALGAEPLLVDAHGLATGASGNPGALVTPRLDAGLGAPAALFAGAFGRAVRLIEQMPQAVISRGVLQLASAERDPARFAKIAASDLFEPGALGLLTPDAVTERMGEAAPAALDQQTALVVEPRRLLEAWAGEVRSARVAALAREGEAWRLLDEQGREVARAGAVIVAAALASRDLLPGLPLQPVRGQASWAPGIAFGQAAAWGGYVLPTRDGVLFGATHDRDDTATDLREADHVRNLEVLARGLPGLAARLADRPLTGRAAVRAVTPDRLPLAGEVSAGLVALTGFGSRGFSMAPWLAEHAAALALGAPSPLPASFASLVDPGRFADRS